MTGMTGMTSNPTRGSGFFLGGPRKVIQQQKAQEGPFQTWMDQQGQGQGQVQEDLPDSQHQSLDQWGHKQQASPNNRDTTKPVTI